MPKIKLFKTTCKSLELENYDTWTSVNTELLMKDSTTSWISVSDEQLESLKTFLDNQRQWYQGYKYHIIVECNQKEIDEFIQKQIQEDMIKLEKEKEKERKRQEKNKKLLENKKKSKEDKEIEDLKRLINKHKKKPFVKDMLTGNNVN